MNAIFTLARLTFFEAIRRRVALAALILGALFLLIFGVGTYAIITSIRAEGQLPPAAVNEAGNFLFMAALYVTNFLLIMMTVLTSVDTLSGEVVSGTMHTIAAKPITRTQIVVGKWLGYVLMLTVYYVLMIGGITLLIRILMDYTPPNLLRGLSTLWLNILLLLGLSLMGGTRLSTLANGAWLFGLYGVSFIGGWIEQIGGILQNETAVNLGILSSLILPTESMWRRAAYEMRSPLGSLSGFGNPFAGGSTPSTIMVAYTVIYALLALAIAIRAFSKRDL